ncbi:hypothetical protein V1281_000083 [Nitrobacteraceae bacterium AZCC 2161]
MAIAGQKFVNSLDVKPGVRLSWRHRIARTMAAAAPLLLARTALVWRVG